MSAPSSKGRCKNGVKKVLSTQWRILLSLAMSEIACKSASLSVGFVGVSVKITLVLPGLKKKKKKKMI